MKKNLCIILIMIFISSIIIGCNNNTTPIQHISTPEPTASPELVIEKVITAVKKIGNTELDYDWNISIDNTNILTAEIVKNNILPIIPTPTPSLTPTPSPTPCVDKVYYIYSIKSNDITLNLAQLYTFGINIYNMYIIMKNDNTAEISFDNNSIIKAVYDDTSFKAGKESLKYRFDNDNIVIKINSDVAVFAPADKVNEELISLSQVVSPIIQDTSFLIATPSPEPTPKPTPYIVYCNNIEYILNFTGLKEGSTIVKLDYQKNNGEITNQDIHESYIATVYIENNQMLVNLKKLNLYISDTKLDLKNIYAE